MAKNNGAATETLEQGLTYGATQDRVFTLKKGTEVVERYDGLQIPFVVAGYGRTAAESWENILARTGGDHIAAVDLFNSAFALALQKGVKTKTAETVTVNKETKEETRTAPTASEAELKTFAAEYVGERNQRRGDGSSGVAVKEAKAKANLLDRVISGELTLEQVQQMMAERAAAAQS